MLAEVFTAFVEQSPVSVMMLALGINLSRDRLIVPGIGAL